MKLAVVIFLSLFSFFINAQQTVGFQMISQGVQDGYTLFAPSSYTKTYLIDNCGHEINKWSSSYRPGQAAYLKNNGNLIRTGNIGGINFLVGGRGGIIEEYDWNGNLIWTFQHGNSQYCMHHDFTILPNGNILAVAWEKIDANKLDSLGRDPATYSTNIWSEKIIEIEPVYPSAGNIVWQWHATDHLIQDFDSLKANYGIISDFPGRFDINYKGSNPNLADWIHFNSIRYNDSLDQILVSSRFFCEIYIIDHSTTTAEATSDSGGIYGKGGEILYRWGNPEAYKRGNVSDRKFFDQHSATWVPYGYPNEGAIAVFNNGVNRPGNDYSSAEMLFPADTGNGNYFVTDSLPYGPDSVFWKYCDTTDYNLYAMLVSSIQPLPNGNFLLTDGPAGKIFEVDFNKNTVWDYISPVTAIGPVSQGSTATGNVILRADKYPSDFIGFSGMDMSPGEPIELSPWFYECDVTGCSYSSNINAKKVFPNPANNYINIPNVCITESSIIYIYNNNGKIVISESHFSSKKYIEVTTTSLINGFYFYNIISDNNFSSGTFIISR